MDITEAEFNRTMDQPHQTGSAVLAEHPLVRALQTVGSWPSHPRPVLEEDLLGEPSARPGIVGTAYDTAWLAGVPSKCDPRVSRFPAALRWLTENQLPDGSWGSTIPYEHDRLLSTLAALAPLAAFGRGVEDQEAVAAGVRYLWEHDHRLAHELVEPVGFELLLPALVKRAQQAGVPVPADLDIYGPQRAAKLRLIPPSALYSPGVTVVHSLEFLGDEADLSGLRGAQGTNGSIGSSPAATAFFFERSGDPRALAYLEDCLGRNGGATTPVLYPCETFELLWSAYHLFLAGVPAERLLSTGDRILLREALNDGGVSLSPTFPIPDADDTAVALLLLHSLGERLDPSVLQSFAVKDGHFASFSFERHSSVGVNLHVLHALLAVPGYPNSTETTDRLLDYLSDQQLQTGCWVDKWHISPIYATAHALCVFGELGAAQARRAAPMVRRAHDWLCETQNSDGSWGWFGQATAEETAYALLALAALDDEGDGTRHSERRRAGLRYLMEATLGLGVSAGAHYPAMWVDKCLYTPPLIVASVIQAARMANVHLACATELVA